MDTRRTSRTGHRVRPPAPARTAAVASSLALVLSLALAVAGLSGCGQGAAGPASHSGPLGPADGGPLFLVGNHWYVESVTLDGETLRAGETARGMVRFTEGGDLQVRACNRMGGRATVRGTGIEVEHGETTLMACPGDQDRLESAIWDFLDGSLDSEITGERLVLSRPDGARMELRAGAATETDDW